MTDGGMGPGGDIGITVGVGLLILHVQHAGLALLGGADIPGDYVIEPP